MSEENFEQLKLCNQLCFPLYVCSKEIVRRYKPYLDKCQLTYTQYIAMMVIWEKQELNVKELGKILYLDSGTLTPVLKTLESKGFISRQRSKEDERNLVVKVTDKGMELRQQCADIPVKMQCCLDIDKEDAQALSRILNKIIGQFDC